MTALAPHVETWAVSREKLACTLKRFREQGAAAGPLTFGAHRKPEGGGAGCGPSERSSTSRNNANFVGKTPTKPNVITEKFRIITGMPTSEKVLSSLSSHNSGRFCPSVARQRGLMSVLLTRVFSRRERVVAYINNFKLHQGKSRLPTLASLPVILSLDPGNDHQTQFSTFRHGPEHFDFLFEESVVAYQLTNLRILTNSHVFGCGKASTMPVSISQPPR